jgi:hypothetical protein
MAQIGPASGLTTEARGMSAGPLVLAASTFGGQLGRYLVAVTPRYWPEAQQDHAQQAAHLVGATQAARMPR